MRKNSFITRKLAYFIIFSSLSFWAIFAYLTTIDLITKQKLYAQLINISGQQRMISQKISLLSTKIYLQNQLQFTEQKDIYTNKMLENHNFIITNITSQNINKILFEEPYNLDYKVKSFLKISKNIPNNGTAFSYVEKYVQTEGTKLLPHLEYLVSVFENESLEKTEILKDRQELILTGTITTLLLEFLFLVLPLIRLNENNEKEIEKKRKKLKAMFDFSSDAILIMDIKNGNLLQFSKIAKEYLGYDEKEMGLLNIKNWDKEIKSLDDFKSLIKNISNTPINLERTMTRKDGSTFIASINAVIINFENTNHLYFSARDITEKKEATQNIIKQKAQLQAITDTSQDAIIMMDYNGQITFWNPAATRILGYTKDEALGKNLHNLITPPRFIPKFKSAFPEFLKTGKGNAIDKTLELFAIHKDGHEIIISLSLNAVFQNNKWNAVGIIRDITEHKELILKNEQKSQTLKDNVLYSRTDTKGIITDVSYVFCRLSGYDKEELIGSSHSIVRHEDMPKELYEKLWETIKSGKTWIGEIKNKSKDGHYYWVSSKITPEYDNNGNLIGYFSIRHDITAQKNYEEQQKLIQEQSKMAALGEMLGNIAHQWRQPLNAITISSSSILMNYKMGILDEENLESFNKNILDNAKYLTKTIETFRNYIRDDKEIKEVILQKIVSNSLAIVKAKLSSLNIKLNDNINYEERITILAPGNELEQVIMNILNNASDALVSNKISTPWIELNISKNEEIVTLTIEDNAGGIPEDILPKIFEPYFTTKHKSQGTGLGLNMSYRIVTESLKGKLYAKNSENGAKFYVEIPYIKSVKNS